MLIGDRLRELREAKNCRREISKSGRACCVVTLRASRTAIPCQRSKRSRKGPELSKFRRTSFSMMATSHLSCQICRSEKLRMTSYGELAAGRRPTFTSCGSASQKLMKMTANSSCSWRKKWQTAGRGALPPKHREQKGRDRKLG